MATPFRVLGADRNPRTNTESRNGGGDPRTHARARACGSVPIGLVCLVLVWFESGCERVFPFPVVFLCLASNKSGGSGEREKKAVCAFYF